MIYQALYSEQDIYIIAQIVLRYSTLGRSSSSSFSLDQIVFYPHLVTLQPLGQSTDVICLYKTVSKLLVYKHLNVQKYNFLNTQFFIQG